MEVVGYSFCGTWLFLVFMDDLVLGGTAVLHTTDQICVKP